MYITMMEARLRPDTEIELMELVSVEGRSYMVRYFIDGECYTLAGKDQKPQLFNSTTEVREAFHTFSIREMVVIPPLGTDEMIGLSTDNPEPMRVRL